MNFLVFMVAAWAASWSAILAGVLLQRNGLNTRFSNNPGKALLTFSYTCLVLAAIINPTAHFGGVTYSGIIIGGLVGGSITLAMLAGYGYMLAQGQFVSKAEAAIQGLLGQLFGNTSSSTPPSQR